MSTDPTLEKLAKQEYKYGFTTDIEQDSIPPGLNEDVVRLISAKKEEPEWLLEWRIKALHRCGTQGQQVELFEVEKRTVYGQHQTFLLPRSR